VTFPDYAVGGGGSGGGRTSSSGSMSSSGPGTGGAPSSGSSSSASGSGMPSASVSSSVGSSGSSCGNALTVTGFTPTTFDVAGDGSVVAVGFDTASNVMFACFDAAGCVLRPASAVTGFTPDSVAAESNGVDVARSSAGTALTWNFKNNVNSIKRNYTVTLDQGCLQIGSPSALDASVTAPAHVYEPAVVRASSSPSSGFFYLYENHGLSTPSLRLVLVTPQGSQKFATAVDPVSCAVGAGRALAALPGNVPILGCRDALANTYYQRFDGGTWMPLDPSPVQVSGLGGPQGTTALLIEGDATVGHFAILSDGGSSSWNALFYKSPGMPFSATPQPFSGVTKLSNDRILALPSGDFVLPIVAGPTNSQVFVATNNCAPGNTRSVVGTPYRVDGMNRLYALSGTTITRSTAPW